MELKVSLTTSKYIASNDSTDFKKDDLPICVTESSIGFFNFGVDLEREENNLANLCKSMARTVYIDSSKNYLFIGENPRDSETALVEYIEERPDNIFAQHFFNRWDKLHVMMFEFSIYSLNKKMEQNDLNFVLKGLWDLNHWYTLKIDTHKFFLIK